MEIVGVVSCRQIAGWGTNELAVAVPVAWPRGRLQRVLPDQCGRTLRRYVAMPARKSQRG